MIVYHGGVTDNEAERIETVLRVAARSLLAESAVPQTQLAELMGVSQSSVSNMLGTRSYGLTSSEVWLIEQACGVPHGSLYMRVGLVFEVKVPDERSLEQQVYEIPGISRQAADAIVAAIGAVRVDVLRERKIAQDQRTAAVQSMHDEGLENLAAMTSPAARAKGRREADAKRKRAVARTRTERSPV